MTERSLLGVDRLVCFGARYWVDLLLGILLLRVRWVVGAGGASAGQPAWLMLGRYSVCVELGWLGYLGGTTLLVYLGQLSLVEAGDAFSLSREILCLHWLSPVVL